MDENNKQKMEAKGFAGLSAFVSDVDTSLPPADERASSSPSEKRDHSADYTPAQVPTNKAVGKTNSGGVLRWDWVAGGVVVIFVVALFALNIKNQKIGSLPGPSYSETTAPSSTQTSSPTSLLPPPQQPKPSRPVESKPPVGQSVVFSTEQIRYCLAEDIRIDGAKSTLYPYSDNDVDTFNAMVVDYNSRCGSFRYRNGALDRAKRDIAPYQSQLRSEGGMRFPNALTAIDSGTGNSPARNDSVSSTSIKLNSTGTTYPTSFDCAKARSIPEHLICHDSELATYDVELAAIYDRAKAAAYDKRAFAERTRKQWNYREKNCRDKECIAAWYAYQRDILTKISITGDVTAK